MENKLLEVVKQKHRMKINNARSTLLAIAVFTAVNYIMLIFNAGYQFLFSAELPYTLTNIVMYYSGLLEDFEGKYYNNPISIDFYYLCIAFTVVIVVAYFLCWLKSKNYAKIPLIAGFVLVMIDSLFILGCVFLFGVEFFGFLTLLIHAYIFIQQIFGLKSLVSLNRLQANSPIECESSEVVPEGLSPQEMNSISSSEDIQ